jgi:hypothetical protein
MMTIARSIGPHRNLPWRLRHQLRRLGDHPHAVAKSSGAKEWSDREIACLRPWRARAFLRRHATRCALLACLYLLAVAFLGASFERYWHWVRTTEAVAGEPVRKVDRWTAHCRVRPWMQGCRPASRAGRGEQSVTVVSAKKITLVWDDSRTAQAGTAPFEYVAMRPGSSAIEERTW